MARVTALEKIKEWKTEHPEGKSKECFEDLTAAGLNISHKTVQNAFSKLKKNATDAIPSNQEKREASKNTGKRGRPATSEKTDRMTIMMTPDDKQRLNFLAVANRQTVADLVSDLIKTAYAEAEKTGRVPHVG